MFRAIRKNGVAKPSSLEAGAIARLLKNMAASRMQACGLPAPTRHDACSGVSPNTLGAEFLANAVTFVTAPQVFYYSSL
jgi:hypothetical protein